MSKETIKMETPRAMEIFEILITVDENEFPDWYSRRLEINEASEVLAIFINQKPAPNKLSSASNYLFLKTGFLFSKNAPTPSFISLDWKAFLKFSDSKSKPSAVSEFKIDCNAKPEATADL